MVDEEVIRRFGQRVRFLRSAKGMSQEALAEAAGLDRTYVGGVERGERNLTLLSASKIAEGLGEPLGNLF